jgi:hypothetical protein
MNPTIQQIQPEDMALMEALLTAFGEAFDEVETYSGSRPSADYLRQLLKNDYFIAIVALKEGKVVVASRPTSLKSSSKNVARSTSTISLSSPNTDGRGSQLP